MTTINKKHISPLFAASTLRPKETYAAILRTNLHKLARWIEGPTGIALAHLVSVLGAGERPVSGRPGAVNSGLWSELLSDASDAHKFEGCAQWLSGQAKALTYSAFAARISELHRSGDMAACTEECERLREFVSEVEGSSPAWVTGSQAVMDLANRRDHRSRGHLLMPFSAMRSDEVVLPEGLTVVGAYPGAGKTALLTTLLEYAAQQKRKPAYLVLEDDSDAIIDRIAASGANVPIGRVRTLELNASESERLQEAYANAHSVLASGWFPSDISRRLSSDAVEAMCREAIERKGADILFVDHIGEIDVSDSERHDLGIDRIAGALVSIATTFHVPVVVAAHLRRKQGADVDTVPQLQDFAFSSSLERKAHLALGLWQTSGADGKRMVGCKVLKSRLGESGAEYAFSWRQPGCTFDLECERLERKPRTQARAL